MASLAYGQGWASAKRPRGREDATVRTRIRVSRSLRIVYGGSGVKRTEALMRWLPGVCLLVALVGNGGCGRGDLYLMSERHELQEDGTRVFSGGGCMLAIERGFGASDSTSSGGGGTVDGDFVEQHESDADGFHVVLRSGDIELARRDYGVQFLASGAVDRFQVTTQAGKSYELAYWGGDDCDASHVPPS